MCQTAKWPNARSVARSHGRRGRKTLLHGLALALPLGLADVGREPPAQAASDRRPEEEECADENAGADQRGDQCRADSEHGIRHRRPRGGGNVGSPRRQDLLVHACDRYLEGVAWTGGREVCELPGPAKLLCEGGVDRLKSLRPGGAGVAAARLGGEALERCGLEARALDPDRIHRDVRFAGGGDRVVEARLAGDLLPVRQEHENPCLRHLVVEQP